MPLSGQTMSVTNTYTPGAVITASGFNTNFTDFATSLTTIATTLQGDLDANGKNIGFDTGTGILDDSGNEQLLFIKTASAVNYFKITNAATGGTVFMEAAGGDSNVTAAFSSKGTGSVILYSGSNSRILCQLTNVASSVNYWQLTPSATGNAIIAAATGSDTNIIMRLDGKGTGGVMIEGTATNDDATAGYVGQFISSTVLVASAVSLTNNTAADVTSISLTAGDWDVWGSVAFNPNAATTQTGFVCSISAVSGSHETIPADGGRFQTAATFTTGGVNVFPTGTRRLSLNSTTTIYLEATAIFGTNTNSAYGFIGARRVR